MAGDILPLGYVWNDALGWHPQWPPEPKWMDAREHLHNIDYKPVGARKKITTSPLFSLENQYVLLCPECGAERGDVNVPMRWPNDIHGDPGTAVAEVEADEFGAITSRTRWLKPGSSTDYR